MSRIDDVKLLCKKSKRIKCRTLRKQSKATFPTVAFRDSLDWKNLPSEEIAERVLKRVKPGSIVLFHNAAVNTPEALPVILEGLLKDGYEIVPVSQLILRDNYTIDSSGMQIPNSENQNGASDKASESIDENADSKSDSGKNDYGNTDKTTDKVTVKDADKNTGKDKTADKDNAKDGKDVRKSNEKSDGNHSGGVKAAEEQEKSQAEEGTKAREKVKKQSLFHRV